MNYEQRLGKTSYFINIFYILYIIFFNNITIPDTQQRFQQIHYEKPSGQKQ